VNARIFVVEDDRQIAERIVRYLKPYGYELFTVKRFERIMEEIQAAEPHLIILDVQLPYQDGFHICRQIREWSHIPILFLSARGGEMEQVYGMEVGADDYMTKPFHLDVLHAKVKALLRRAYGSLAMPGQENHLTVGNLRLDLDRMEIVYRGEAQLLTKNEWKLLKLLLEQAGKTVTREECLEALWDDVAFVDDNTLTVNVNRVRKKLERWDLDSSIETKRGVGYRFNPDRVMPL